MKHTSVIASLLVTSYAIKIVSPTQFGTLIDMYLEKECDENDEPCREGFSKGFIDGLVFEFNFGAEKGEADGKA